MKKAVRIDFVDFEKEFEKKNNFIYHALSRHYDVEICPNPDYLFFSVFSDENLRYDCIKIFYTGENLCPDFNLCDYAIGYEYMDYGDRFFRLPYYMRNETNCRLMEKKHLNVGEGLAQRKFCNFVYSNDNADPVRRQFFELLSEYRQVDSGGRYLNNVGEPCEDKLSFQKSYKFSIAFENSSHPGYTTEKIVDAFAAQTVPVYWGDTEIERVFDPKAFIHVKDRKHIEDAIELVRELDRDEHRYLEVLRRPALLESAKNYAAMQAEFENFLQSIIEQDMEKAYRRNRVFWGKTYQEKHLRYYDDYLELLSYKIKLNKLIPVRGIRAAIKKVVGKSREKN